MGKDYRDIRYIKLHFKVRFLEDTSLPVQKASMLRGGMGEMLLRTCCISDRKCEECGFESECLVRRIMYSKMEIQPEFMSSGDSVGYVVECDNYKTEFETGDTLDFRVLLIGKTIVYFSQILEAFYRLGLSGMGKENAKYTVVEVLNSKKEPIMDGNDIHMERVVVNKLGDYIDYRLKKTAKNDTDSVLIKFDSPLSIKYRGEQIDEFDVEAIVKALERRLYILCCFEGIQVDKNLYVGEYPDINVLKCKKIDVPRYSFRKSEKMVLWGLEGEVGLEGVNKDLLELLLTGELIHIGKNTSFGFGKYRVVNLEELWN